MRTFNSQAFPCRPTFHSHNNLGISAHGFLLSYLTNPPVAFCKKNPKKTTLPCILMTSSKYIGLQRKQTKSKFWVSALFSDFFFCPTVIAHFLTWYMGNSLPVYGCARHWSFPISSHSNFYALAQKQAVELSLLLGRGQCINMHFCRG